MQQRLCSLIPLTTALVLLAAPPSAAGARAAARLADPSAWNAQLEIGPVAGLTTLWHPAPLAAALPLGAVVQFKMRKPVGAAVTWTGASEIASEILFSFAEHRFDTAGRHTVSASYIDGQGQRVEESAVLEVIDTTAQPMTISARAVAVEPVILVEGNLNRSTAGYFFRDESIAALRELGPDSYRTSIDRWLRASATVTPAAFAPLVEWRVNGEPQHRLGAEVDLRLLQPGSHEITAGYTEGASTLHVETYSVKVIGPFPAAEVADGVPATFRAETQPPGFEEEVTWLASTKFGGSDPVLGQGRDFTVTFAGTFRGTRQWLGVRADNGRFSQDREGETPLGPPSFRVNPALAPSVPTLPGFDGATPRPLASVRDEFGNQADFVADELWLSTDDPAELATFLDRWQGEVVLTFDPTRNQLEGIASQYLVRVHRLTTDAAGLASDLLALEPAGRGVHEVSSLDGLKLLATGADEVLAGRAVGVNWVGRGSQFRDKASTEASSGDGIGGTPYSSNAFTWPTHQVGGVQDIGVAEAWRLLDLAGGLDNTVKLAILDMGFAPNDDFPDWFAISNVPFVEPIGSENLLSCGSGGSCPWHGTSVLSAGASLADNRFGGAGPAGPVAYPILVFTSYDFFTSIVALGEARALGAKVANMSYGARVPLLLAWSVLPFEVATIAFRASGMLLFASAGNDGDNVDSSYCVRFIGCIEKAWYTPCENDGVTCVGGLAWNSNERASDSNYGSEAVDIFAPYTLWVGPDPGAPADHARQINGTSFSSPFTAGVAALIWAANPDLSAGQVEDILLDTAHTGSPDRKVRRWVDALAAVHKAVGNVPPAAAITAPTFHSRRDLNWPVILAASAEDFEDGAGCCTFSWSSDLDGLLGSGATLVHAFATEGTHRLTAFARDSGGAISFDSILIEIVNSPPVPVIERPLPGETIYQGLPFRLRGSASDRNEPGQTLACGGLIWRSSLVADPLPGFGCEVPVTFTTTGPRTLTLYGTDPQGETSSTSVLVNVLPPPANLPPAVAVRSPEPGSVAGPDERFTVAGLAVDPEGATPLTYRWTVTYPFDPGSGSGPTTATIGSALEIDWKPSDTITFERCEVDLLIRLRLEVSDPGGTTGSDFVVLRVLRIC